MNIRYLLMLFVVSTFLFSKDKNHNLKEQVSLMDLNNSAYFVEEENTPLISLVEKRLIYGLMILKQI